MNYLPRTHYDPKRILRQTLFATSTEKIKKPRKAVKSTRVGRKKVPGIDLQLSVSHPSQADESKTSTMSSVLQSMGGNEGH